MSNIKKGFRVISIVFSVLWTIILIFILVRIFLYKAPTADPQEIYLNKGLYKIFAIVAAMGAFSSGVQAICLCRFSYSGYLEIRILKVITLCAAVLSNLLVYVSAYSLLFVDVEHSLTAPIAWGICTTICVMLLVFLNIRYLIDRYTEMK